MKTSETELGLAVMKVLASETHYTAPVRTLVQRVPEYIRLSPDDLATSTTRPKERVWEQRIRNLKSHQRSEGNILGAGLVERPRRGTYRLTTAGVTHLRNKSIID